MSRHHVVLVPGFFGFGSLGAMTYFVGVREALSQAFERLSLDVNVVEVPTLPTASIRHRAGLVHETLVSVAEAEPGPIHIVGHSTGGLDARLAIAPTASLPTTRKFHEHERLRTLVTLSTPHFGTPLASLFGSAAGSPLLRMAATLLIHCLKRGRLPVGLGLRLGGWFTRVDGVLGFITEEAKNQAVPRHRRNVGVERTEVEPSAQERSEGAAGPASRPPPITARDRAHHALQGLSEFAPDKTGRRAQRKPPPAAAQ